MRAIELAGGTTISGGVRYTRSTGTLEGLVHRARLWRDDATPFVVRAADVLVCWAEEVGTILQAWTESKSQSVSKR